MIILLYNNNYILFIRNLPLKISVYPISFVKYQLYVSMDYSFRVNTEMMGGSAEKNEFDEIKVTN